MPKGRPKKKAVEEEMVVADTSASAEKSEKDKLLDLYKTLTDLGIRSIGNLENMIANIK